MNYGEFPGHHEQKETTTVDLTVDCSKLERADLDALDDLMVDLRTARTKKYEMSDNSAIEWTDATWNPTTGCTKVPTGCDRCYAERIALRFGRSFDLELHPDRLEKPLTWRRPRRVFVNSVSDLFHRDVPWGFVDQVFDIMEAAEHLIFQVLTKRSSTMRDYLRSRYAGRECPAHIWCVVSVEEESPGESEVSTGEPRVSAVPVV